ncbi:reverse transcriptase domain-containing protein, partial [Tanacetum coccineum]
MTIRLLILVLIPFMYVFIYIYVLNDEESLPKVSLDDMNVDEQEEKLIDTVKVIYYLLGFTRQKKRKKSVMKTNYVLRSAKERKKRLAMALETPFGQQPTTTPVPPKRISRSVNCDFILPLDFKEPKMRSINELITMEVFVEQLSRPQNCKKDKVSMPDGLAEYLQMEDPPNYHFPWGYRDITVDREFCTLIYGWISCGVLDNPTQIGPWYPVAWRDVEKVYFPVNEPKRHWCLAELHITTGLVTFYDSLGWSKGIAVKRYEITYKFPTVIKQANLYGDCGYERVFGDSGDSYKHYLLVTFDMINHRFQEIAIPNLLMRGLDSSLYVSKLRNSLVLSGNIPTPAFYVFVCCQLLINGGSITSFLANVYADVWTGGLMCYVDLAKEKLKAVKARLNFKETSHHSELGTPTRRRGLKERLRPRYVRSRSGSPKLSCGRYELPKKKGSERKTVFKRLEKGIFHRLGDKGKSVYVYSDDSRRRSYHSSHRDTKSCHQSSRSRTTEPASERRYNKRASSRRTEELSESEGSAGDPFTPRICYFDFPKTRMPSHIKTYDGSEDPEDPLKIFQLAAKTERWAMPTWCHMFNSTLTGNARVWITNPELIKRLHDKIPKSVDEMMRVTTTFIRGGVVASNRERKKSFPSWKQQEANQKQNFKKGGFRNQQRSERKQDRFALLTKTPKEIFALDKGKFKASPPMTTPVEKRNANKFCEFHGEVGHNTDECMHLRKQIEEMFKAGKLSHLVKEIKQNNEKEQPKVTKKGETAGKDKAMAILLVQPWERVLMQRITQSFSPNSEISFPPLGEDEGTKGPMIIDAEIGGHCVHHMYVDGGSTSEILYEHCFSRLRPKIKRQLI